MWVFVAAPGLPLVEASGDYSLIVVQSFPLRQLLLLLNTVLGHAGFVAVAHGLSCQTACGIFPDQGSKPCPLH